MPGDNQITYVIRAVRIPRPQSPNLDIESGASDGNYVEFTPAAVAAAPTFPSNVMMSIILSTCVKFVHLPTGSVVRMKLPVPFTVTSCVW